MITGNKIERSTNRGRKMKKIFSKFSFVEGSIPECSYEHELSYYKPILYNLIFWDQKTKANMNP